MEFTIINKGRQHNICSVTQGSRCHVLEFIEGLEQKDQKKVFVLLRRVADHGLPHNEEKYHKLKGVDICEFKSFQVRLLFFRDGARIILTHGFIKKGDSTPKSEIERAVNIQKQYFKVRK